MSHVLVYPFAGAGCGVVAAITVVPAIGSTIGGSSDGTVGITLIVGTFLAGAGAVAGAILGAAEMFITRTDRMQSTQGPDLLATDTLNPHPRRD
jgi:hypothetical protein